VRGILSSAILAVREEVMVAAVSDTGVDASSASSSTPSPDVGFDHVLVPSDGSSFSLGAMPTARALAERFGADLHTIGVARGDPAVAIARRADELGSCLVCMSSHGRGRLSGALLGSVATSVLEHSGGAVVTVGPMARGPGWTPPPRSWPEPLSTRRIVACVDGSDASEEVLSAASGWSRALGMSLTILTVAEETSDAVMHDPVADRYGSGRDGRDYIQELTRRWQATVPDVEGVVLEDPIGPASAIREYLAQQPADLVALRTHPRSGLRRVLRPATAATIVRASTAPCLVVPSRRPVEA
jgi:nucleotide-binding universal stress UspA family protein